MFNPYKTTTAPSAHIPTDRDDLLALWTLRAQLCTGAWRRLLGNYHAESTLRAAGLPTTAVDTIRQRHESDDDALDALESLLRHRLGRLEEADLPRQGPLFDNVDRLADALDLTSAEQELLIFAVFTELEDGFDEGFDEGPRTSQLSLTRHLAHILDLPADDVRRALVSDATLPSTGILCYDTGFRGSGVPLELMSGFSALLTQQHDSTDALLRPFFAPAPTTPLTLEDFAHLGHTLDVLRRYLSGALDQRQAGANVLLYGPPGTGKTELARALAKALGASLVAVSTAENDDSPFSRMSFTRNRLSRYALCQRVLRRRQGTLVLFDEVEDVFPTLNPLSDLFGLPAPRSHGDKGRTNRHLESNPTPAIWITNSIRPIDPAFLRRFDVVLPLDTPPRPTRRRIVARHLHDLPADPAFLDDLADDPRLTPADLDRAARVARLAHADGPDDLKRTVTATLQAGLDVRQASPRPRRRDPAAGTYDLDLLNADLDVHALAKALATNKAGTVGLMGPPGTGKTAFAHHVAQRAHLELLHRKASDLLGPYVGQTERAVAHAFHLARQQGAALLIDEVDSLIQDRRGASAEWRVSLTNELLVQLEAFDGLFFCCTNLTDALDPALFRRLDVKVRLDPLTPHQAWRLARDLMARLEVTGADAPAIERRVRKLEGLTVGDVAAVERRWKLVGGDEAEGVVEALEGECGWKVERRVGF